MPEPDILLPQFALAVRGYDRSQVDDYVARLAADLEQARARALVAEQRLEELQAPLPDPATAAPAPLPVAGLAPAAQDPPPHRVGGRLLVVGAIVALLAGGGAVAAVTSRDKGPSAVAGAETNLPEGEARALPAVAAGVADRRDTAGPAADALLGALRRLHALTGLERRARALSLARDVEVATARGELLSEVAGIVLPALQREARPEDVVRLAELVAVDPTVVGAGGPQLLERLRDYAANPEPAVGRQLVEDVRGGPAGGVLTETFTRTALPVLERSLD